LRAADVKDDFSLSDAVDLLARTPGVLDTLLRDLPEQWALADEGPDTFSPFEVVGHLIHGERADWMVRLGIILEQGPEATFEPYDRFAQREASRGMTLGELLSIFRRLRRNNLEALVALDLTPEDLERGARHPELGPVTARQLLAGWVVHDQSHLAQISRVLAKRYRDAVGPWRPYMPILDR